MIRLVLSDMDGTLVPLHAQHVSARTLVAIRALQAEGIEFGPSTGRGTTELSPFFLDDHRYFRTGILSNGKKVYVDGRVVEEHLMPHESLLRLHGIVQRYPQTMLVVYPEQSRPGNPVWCIGGTGEQRERLGRLYKFIPMPRSEVPEEPAIGCVVACDAGPAVVDELMAQVAGEVPTLDIVQQYPGWCDVMPHGVSKASGLQALVDALDIDRDEIVFFGDGDNDVTLLEAIPNGVAVANARPKAAVAARWHVGACEDDGVAKAMEQIARAAHNGGVPEFMHEKQ